MIEKNFQYNSIKKSSVFFVILLIIGTILMVFLNQKEYSVGEGGLNPWLGVETVELSASIRKEYGVHSPNGLLVSRVFIKSPAAAAGIKQGDIIRRWGGKSITSLQQFQTLIRNAVLNQSIKLVIDRRDRQRLIYATLSRRPGTF